MNIAGTNLNKDIFINLPNDLIFLYKWFKIPTRHRYAMLNWIHI